MEQIFKNWLIKRGYSETGAANSYSRAIPLISAHYSEKIGEEVDIFSLSKQQKISEISHDYSQTGKFSEFGYEQHSRFRNAIARYSEFFVYKNNTTPEASEEKDQITEQESNNELVNFAYERDLQMTLCSQISELFPNYKIFGDNNAGIEFQIKGKRIDVLLEHEEEGNLLAVELKSGEADYKVFGQISMYLGLLKNKFPDALVSGVIVAGSINKSLHYACETTDKIQLRIYRMNLELEEA